MKFLTRIFLISLLAAQLISAQISLIEQKPPGKVVAYSDAKSGIFIGSPSLLILPNGNYLASHDFFGKSLSQGITHIYKSTDQGNSWEKIAELKNQFWSNLFKMGDTIYIMGTTKEYGAVVIRKSTDFGYTWTTPRDKFTGILLNDGEYHTAPVPVVINNGKIWRSMEDRNPPTDWGKNFRAFVMSAPINSDLLNAENWECTNRLSYDPKWPGSAWLEGNVVETPKGYLWNILRNHTKTGEKAAVTKVGLTGKVLSFDPNSGFIDFPGGSVKFTIRFDSVSNKYYSITNYIPFEYKNGNPERTRNTLALTVSDDLINWYVDSIILHSEDVESIGFQYVDFRFEGDDIIFLSRTAYYQNDGHKTNQHDSNYLTFHRLKDFRK